MEQHRRSALVSIVVLLKPEYAVDCKIERPDGFLSDPNPQRYHVGGFAFYLGFVYHGAGEPQGRLFEFFRALVSFLILKTLDAEMEEIQSSSAGLMQRNPVSHQLSCGRQFRANRPGSN